MCYALEFENNKNQEIEYLYEKTIERSEQIKKSKFNKNVGMYLD
jgi:hypothetical protein